MRLFTHSTALLVMLVLATGVRAQEMPLQVNLDHANFAYDADYSLLEVYLAFEAASLRYVADPQGFRARLPVDLELLRNTVPNAESAPPVWADSLTLNFIVADTTGLVAGQHFVHQVRTAVPPGEYALQVIIPASASPNGQELMLRRDVLVGDFSDTALVGISDITLATAIQRGPDRQDPFYKNGLIIRPNANQLFGSGLDKVFYYAEAYNLDQLGQEQYTFFSYIAEANLPQPLPGLQRRVQRPARSPDVLVGQFDISALPSGSYFLRLALLNAQNEAVAEQVRKFFVYNPDVARAAPVAYEESFETSPFATMPEEEVEATLAHIDVIINEQERRRIRGIKDLDERRRFLMEFWFVRDPSPGSAVNEFKESFYQRLQYANDRYTSSFQEGWETDRGRALLKFGTPTGIEPHLFDRGFAPYERWEYNNIPGEGQALFIFADLDGFGRFELIHSTVTGERKLSNWIEELRQSQ